jgi:Ca2+-dependent lipid-binding protein
LFWNALVLQGVLRVYVYEAYNLFKADLNIFEVKRNPYVKICGCGNPEFKTKVIQNNWNLIWNEIFHLIIEDEEGNPNLNIDIYDENISEDDHVGGIV